MMRFKNKTKWLLIAPLILMVGISILSGFSISSFLYKNKESLRWIVDCKNQVELLLDIDISLSIVQNMMHIPVFALLAFLWMTYICKKRKIQIVRAGLYVIVIILLFGVLDEAHQFFVKGRDASLMDLGLDFIGGFFGIFIYRIKNTKEKSLTNK